MNVIQKTAVYVSVKIEYSVLVNHDRALDDTRVLSGHLPAIPGAKISIGNVSIDTVQEYANDKLPTATPPRS